MKKLNQSKPVSVAQLDNQRAYVPAGSREIMITDLQIAEHQKKLAASRAAHLRDRDYEGYFITFGKHERQQSFFDIVPLLSDRDYWRTLRKVWIEAKIILPEKRNWLQLLQLNRPGREHHLMTGVERAALAAMPDKIKIWRGCGNRFGVRGFSWTLDRKVAVVFADSAWWPRCRRLGKRLLVQATCRKSDVIAFFKSSNESEILINPKHVTVLRTSRASAPKKKDPEEVKRELKDSAAAILASLLQPESQPAEN